MQISITKLTDVRLMRKACEKTMHGAQSQITLAQMYECEHSPMRTQLFWIDMDGIPTFVSVHFVRHKIGVEHFVTSNREDRGGDNNVDRYTLVNHGMLCNAQALINMARKRLCYKASAETRAVMCAIKAEMLAVDLDLANHLVPDCMYRGGKCHELRPCGFLNSGETK